MKIKAFNNKSGFTLIEIIVVLIIVGILAAIALPNLFSNVAKSKGAQALTSMDGIKSGLESYYVLHSTTAPTAASQADLTAAGLTTSTIISGVTFTYGISAAATAAQSITSGAINTSGAGGGTYSANTLIYTITACDGGLNAGNCITLQRAATGSFTCSAPSAGNYVGLC